MKTDAYTKSILTVIALCLMWICVRELPVIRRAEASGGAGPTEVIVRNSEPLPVAIYAQVDTKNPNMKYTFVPVEALGLDRDIYSNYRSARLMVSVKE